MQQIGAPPLVRPILGRLQVWRLARLAAAGDIPAARTLAAIFCTSPDPRVRIVAGRGLMHLERSEQTDLLCRESLLRDNVAFVNLVTGSGYFPSAPAGHALWLFCTSRIEELRHLEPDDNFPLLAIGYTSENETIRARVRDAASRDGTEKILARALTGTEVTRNAASWSYGEWQIVVSGLVSGKRWIDLWLLAPFAPLPLAMKAIRALIVAEWAPRGDDRLAWDKLVAALPDRCTYPILSGKPRGATGGPAGQVVRSCFSTDGSLLATGSSDGMIVVRPVTSAGSAREFSAGPGAVRFLALPPGGETVITATDSGILRCHDLQTGSLLWSRTDAGETGAIALSSDGSFVLAGDLSGTLRVFGTCEGRLFTSLLLHPSAITCIAAAPDRNEAAFGHADGSVSISLPRVGTLLRVLPGNGRPVLSISFGSSGTECTVVYERGFPVRWDPVSGEIRAVYDGASGKALCSAAPSSGEWLAVGSDDHMLRFWDRDGKKPLAVIPLYKRNITSCSAAPDGNYLAAGFLDGSVHIWSMPRAVQVREYKAHRKTVTSCIFAPGSSRLATVSWEGKTKIWRIPVMEIVRTFDAHSGGIAALAGPAGTLVAAVTGDGVARLMDGSCGTVLRSFDLYVARVRAAAMSPDGVFLAITGSDSTIRCWNTRDGSLLASGEVQATSHWCCTFVPDRSVLVTGGWDGACRLFSLPGMTHLRTLRGHKSIVTCCTVSRDGSLIVTGSNDTTVRFWRTDEEEAYAVLRESRSEVGAVALSPDGQFLAAGCSDGTIRLYRLPYGTLVLGFPGLPGRVTSLAFTDDSCFLAAGYDTGTCALFSIPEHSLVGTVPAHSGAVTGLAVLPGNNTLVTTGTDGRCCIHNLPLLQHAICAGPVDIPAAATGNGRIEEDKNSTGAFNHALLTARFREEIMISQPPDTSWYYDIQIAG